MGEKSMIRVGFIGAVSKEWMGGLNYYKNLLYALSILDNKQIEPIVFVGKQTDENIKIMFRQYALVIEHSLFDRKSIPWFLWKSIHRLFGSSFLLEILLKKHQIKVLSHSDIVGLKTCKTVNWIPDFQHLHLPHMFSDQELQQRNKHFIHIARESDVIVVSSYDALNDFTHFAPQYSQKAKALQFVSQPDKKYFLLNDQDEIRLKKKFSLPRSFFYLPNQFWKHKNHMLAFEAIKLLKKKGHDITVVCTGYLHDYRNIEHIDNLQRYISEHKLDGQIRLLGLVDYEEVFALIKFSKAVINPSLFEGWSSTVEECKSVGKHMILSDLNVHIEQYPEATFFPKNDANALAEVLASYDDRQPNPLQFDLKSKTRQFAQEYENIVLGVLK